MAGSSFTFRCGECNRLLGVSRSRVGSTVQCPKCGCDLIVPDPDEVGAEVRPDPRLSGSGSSSSGESVTVGAAAEGRETTGFAGLSIEPEPLSLRSREPSRPYRIPERRPEPPPIEVSPATTARPEEGLAGLRVEEPLIRDPDDLTLAPATRSQARPGDVVLPRTAVLLWSFVMLLALVFAFAAGVLGGHFLWIEKTSPQPTVPSAPAAAPTRAP